MSLILTGVDGCGTMIGLPRSPLEYAISCIGVDGISAADEVLGAAALVAFSVALPLGLEDFLTFEAFSLRRKRSSATSARSIVLVGKLPSFKCGLD